MEDIHGSMSYGNIGKSRSGDIKDDESFATAAFTSHAESRSYSMDDGSISSEFGTEIIMPRDRTPGSAAPGGPNGAYGWFKSTTPYSAHISKARQHTFTVDSFIRLIGSGAYGVVILAHDTVTNTRVALREIKISSTRTLWTKHERALLTKLRTKGTTTSSSKTWNFGWRTNGMRVVLTVRAIRYVVV